MSKKNKVGVLLLAVFLMPGFAFAVSPPAQTVTVDGKKHNVNEYSKRSNSETDPLQTALNDIRTKAAAAVAVPENAAARQALLDAVSSAITILNTPTQISQIIAAAVAAAPSRAAAIASAAVKVAPAQAAAITGAAVRAAPTQAVTITVAALESTPNKSQTTAIVNSAMRAAPRDSQTLADLQSLATRNGTLQNNARQQFENTNRNNNEAPLPKVDSLRGGASPN